MRSEDWPCRVEARESFGRTGCFSVLGKVPIAKVSTSWSPVGGKGSSPSRVTKTVIEASDCWQLEWLSVWTCLSAIYSQRNSSLAFSGWTEWSNIYSQPVYYFIHRSGFSKTWDLDVFVWKSQNQARILGSRTSSKSGVDSSSKKKSNFNVDQLFIHRTLCRK